MLTGQGFSVAFSHGSGQSGAKKSSSGNARSIAHSGSLCRRTAVCQDRARSSQERGRFHVEQDQGESPSQGRQVQMKRRWLKFFTARRESRPTASAFICVHQRLIMIFPYSIHSTVASTSAEPTIPTVSSSTPRSTFSAFSRSLDTVTAAMVARCQRS